MRIRKGRKYRKENRFRVSDFDALESSLVSNPRQVLTEFKAMGGKHLQDLPFWERLKGEISQEAKQRIICTAILLGIPEGIEVTV